MSAAKDNEEASPVTATAVVVVVVVSFAVVAAALAADDFGTQQFQTPKSGTARRIYMCFI